MIATSHVIIGGAVGLATQNPVAGLAAGIASHLFCDAIPHLDAPFRIELINGEYDKPKWTKKLLAFAIADSILAFVLTLYIWDRYFDLNILSPFAWGALGGYLPDFLDNVPLWSAKLRSVRGFKQFHALHLWVHNTWRFRYPMPEYWFLGTISQVLFVIPALLHILSR